MQNVLYCVSSATPGVPTETPPCENEIPDLPEGIDGCGTPEDVTFEIDIPTCEEAILMNLDIEVSGIDSIEVITIAVDGTEYTEIVSGLLYMVFFRH